MHKKLLPIKQYATSTKKYSILYSNATHVIKLQSSSTMVNNQLMCKQQIIFLNTKKRTLNDITHHNPLRIDGGYLFVFIYLNANGFFRLNRIKFFVSLTLDSFPSISLFSNFRTPKRTS